MLILSYIKNLILYSNVTGKNILSSIHNLRWLLGLRKMRFSKKAENLVSWRKETASFLYCHYEIIFYCAELFECAFIFKYSQTNFIFLNIKANQASKEQDLNFIRNSHLFWEQRQRGVLEVNFQASNFTVRLVLRSLVIFFEPVLEIY